MTRAGAMLHGAIHDACNSFAPTSEPNRVRVPVGPEASLDAAIAYAAHDTLAAVFPSCADDVARELAVALTDLEPPAIAGGRVVGTACAAATIADRARDGSHDATPYAGGERPGDWRSACGGDPETPHWPGVKPFAMVCGSQFRPAWPDGHRCKAALLASPGYAAQLEEVKRLGDATSAWRTAQETEIARFWANDLDGTAKLPGQLFQITRRVSEQRGLCVHENARLFALVAIALADAAICAWDAKFAAGLELWRPETAIHLAGDDGNDATDADAAWEPLSRDGALHFTPPTPSFVSCHAALGAAHATIMRSYFATDEMTFTVCSEDPSLPTRVTRTYTSFTAAARELARSRVLLGVAFGWDAEHGLRAGAAVGEHVLSSRLRARVATGAGVAGLAA